MVKLATPACDFGRKAVDFKLSDANGKMYALSDCVSKNSKGLLVMFICNHCPYVQAISNDLVGTTDRLAKYGIDTVAIMSNNWEEYPEDSPEKMREFQKQCKFNFPYLIDETQEVAKQYGAVCTPDFFGYNKSLELQYRGRFDARGRDLLKADSNNQSNQLEQAMLLIAQTEHGPEEQYPSIGCSIKWKEK